MILALCLIWLSGALIGALAERQVHQWHVRRTTRKMQAIYHARQITVHHNSSCYEDLALTPTFKEQCAATPLTNTEAL